MKFEDIKVNMNVTDEIDSKVGCGRVVSKDCQHKIVTVKFNGDDIVYFNNCTARRNTAFLRPYHTTKKNNKPEGMMASDITHRQCVFDMEHPDRGIGIAIPYPPNSVVVAYSNCTANRLFESGNTSLVPFLYNFTPFTVDFKIKDKTVTAMYNGIEAKATCSNKDKFDKVIGKCIAFYRLDKKIAKKEKDDKLHKKEIFSKVVDSQWMERLAWWIANYKRCDMCAYKHYKEDCATHGCTRGILKWLNKKHKE
jgi:hypothetical protein